MNRAGSLDSLKAMVYPGRLIIIGKDESGKNDVVVYAITGRSPSSQARKLELEDDAIWAKPTDKELIKKGNIDLLIYPAIFLSKGIAVSNGKQTTDIKTWLVQSQDAVDVLASAMHKWDYEPDHPTFTPRISGCIQPHKKAALCIIKRGEDGSSIRNFFEVPLTPGMGKMISTYEGENRDPLPAFIGEPVDIEIKSKKADELAEAVYSALEPEEGREDFRVSVACVFSTNLNSDEYEVFIINKHERRMKEDG
jgi:IMP cyclohydrolase